MIDEESAVGRIMLMIWPVVYAAHVNIGLYGAITTKSSILYLTKTQQLSAGVYNVTENHTIGPTHVNDMLEVISFIDRAKCLMIQLQKKLYEGHGKKWYCEPMDKDDPFKIILLWAYLIKKT